MPRPTSMRGMPPLPPPHNPPMTDHHYADSYNEGVSYNGSTESSYNSYNSRMPPMSSSRATSSRGGLPHASYRERPHHGYHHPYARPGATPYGETTSHHSAQPPPYGYDYYGEKSYMYGQQRPQPGGPHQVDPSPREEDEPGMSMAHQHQHPHYQTHHMHHQPQPQFQRHPAQDQQHNEPQDVHSNQTPAKKEVKKPPRPYTEYNIFFQLERERILGELEEEQRKKKAGGDEGDGKDAKDNDKVETSKDSKDTDDKEVKKEANEASGSSSPKEEPSEPAKYTTPTSPGVILNRPSDTNDVLPRPARFAHLQLAPLWYDSTHRLAQSKLNKSRRKHRKTHGLVGFLDLTRRIAKAWSEVDPETKGYCKKVADRQLKIYKEELKLMKKKQTLLDSSAGTSGAMAVAGLGSMGGNAAEKEAQSQVQQQMILRMKESANCAAANANTSANATASGGAAASMPHPPSSAPPGYPGMRGGNPREGLPGMPPPPPPPPSGPGQSPHPSSHPGPHPGSAHHGYNKYWQHQQYSQQQGGQYSQAPTPHSHYRPPSHRGAGGQHSHPSTRPYYPPSIPPLTPTTEYADERSSYYGGGGMLTPLDELMHRRKLYGSQSAAQRAQARTSSPRKRSPGTSRHHVGGRDPSAFSAGKGPKFKDSEENLKPSSGGDKSFLSPPDNEDLSPNDAYHKTSTAAITPSPSRRHAGMLQSPSSAGMSPPSAEAETPTAAGSAKTLDGSTPSAPIGTPMAGSMTPSQLPMKKRRKQLEREQSAGMDTLAEAAAGAASKDAAMTPGSHAMGGKPSDESTPSSGNSGSSPLFSLSPSGVMTPRGPDASPHFNFGASPLSGGSYRKALVGPYLNDDNSSFPYIDWGSPHEGGSPHDASGSSGKGSHGSSPQDAQNGGMSHRSTVPPHLGVPGSYGHPGHHQPPPPSSHPSSHYPHHPGGHPGHHPSSRYPPGSQYPPSPYLGPAHAIDDFADQDVLDLDEEEMQLLWRKLATHAKRKRMRERDAAAQWMYHYGPPGPGGGPPASPGAFGQSGSMKMAHSFSSPMERPELASRGASSGSAVVMKNTSSPSSNEGNKEDMEKKKDLTLKDD